MGILNRLVDDGSEYSIYTSYGINPANSNIPVNPLATKQSNLHYDTEAQREGYSVLGDNAPHAQDTIQNYANYKDGTFNPIPQPTNLELNDPIGADPNYKPLYTSQNGGYASVAKQLQQQ